MEKFLLSGTWKLQCADGTTCEGTVPGSVYSILLANGKLPDPFYRDNEFHALELMEQDFCFTHTFFPNGALLRCKQILLHCDGLDTLCALYMNGHAVGKADNMHRTWEFDVTRLLREGENELKLRFDSPTRYIREAYERDFIGGSTDAMKGFPHLRKAHCMFGWDWGPRLPDAGVFREICLLGVMGSRLEDVHITQRHEGGHVFVTTDIQQSGEAAVQIRVQTPDGEELEAQEGVALEIPNPQLWWPNGYGAHPLYTVHVRLFEDGRVTDEAERRIGLRTMTVARQTDEWGESFAHCVNGVQIFAMGADYIPEDNILSRVTPARTRRLLEQCVAAHFNAVRVWGGGYYPDDFFYDICDELGLIVWQDFMFACANYHLTRDFEENIRAEFIDNVKRLRHHASLGLWCGNNEMEMFQASGEYQGNFRTKADYIRMFEHMIPEVLRQYDPDTFYWPASPSSGGSFDEPNDPNRGDVHCWDVWHGGKPFSDYRKNFFRYASEFGFESFPSMRTVEQFTRPEDRNIFSRVMELHQRSVGANGKIMNYLSQTFLYPRDFETLLYASQLLQAEAMRYAIEHWRRNRGRCMGAIYWQLNDIWPVASWSSIDYYGRWKALHYYAKRFFAPVMLSCEEVGETTDRLSVIAEPSPIETRARFSVANETMYPVAGVVRWELRTPAAKVLESGEFPVEVPALTSIWLPELDFHTTNYHENYLSYSLETNEGTVSCGTVLFTACKHYHFADPSLSCRREGDAIVVSAAAFAKSVEIYSPDSDFLLDDNFFDMNAGQRIIKILEGDPQTLCVRSVYNIR
jgi:beta-mannosidase